MRVLKSVSLVATLAVLFFLSCKHSDDTTILSRRNVKLEGSQEVPPKTGTGTGSIDYDYNKATRTLSFTVTFSGMSDTVIAAHIHGSAQKGYNASPVQDYTAAIPKRKEGTYSNSMYVDGVKITEQELLRGSYYFNIHTKTNPGGEIRAQIVF